MQNVMPFDSSPTAEPSPFRAWLVRAWRRMTRSIHRHILHQNDNPHRVARGVFLGFFVGWTPTMGLQLPLYLGSAFLLRASKVSGLPPLLATNPFTALPIYLFNWHVGRWLMNSIRPDGDEHATAAQVERLKQFFTEFSVSRIMEAEHWKKLQPLFQDIGLELWIGSLAVGAVLGLLGYAAAFYGLRHYRRRRERRAASPPARRG